MLNSCDFQGRICGEPKFFDDEPARCTFTLRVERDQRNDDGRYDSDFLDFIAWRSTADFIHEYLHDGDFVVISDARAQLRRYSDKSGLKHRRVEFLVGRVYFGSFKPKDCGEEINS